MRVLYVAPRFHTNQIPVVKGWLERGNQVVFISQFAGTPEDYRILRPVILGYSHLFEEFMRLFCVLFCRNAKSETREFAFRVKAGFPPFGKAGKHIVNFQPDLVILRERSVYNVPFYLTCKKKNIPCLLYNQSPLWDIPQRDMGLRKKLFSYFFPKWRITPVMGKPENGNIKTKNAEFVPFVMEMRCSPERKGHFLDGKIQALCVGRYEERKNLFFLVEAIKELIPKYKIHLTMIGEATDINQKEHYEKLQKFISEYRLENDITLLKNHAPEQMYQAYKKADLFVLPSTKERASISQLEAMSCSLPVICSDTNGSACYVEDGVNGYLFRDNDREDLQRKIEQAVANKDNLQKMGVESYRLVKENYQFSNYYEKVMEMVK